MGNIKNVSFTLGSPEDTEARQIAERRRMAQALLAQSDQQLPAGQMAGQVFVPTSPLQHIAQALKAANARNELRQADERERQIADNAAKNRQAVLARALSVARGTPGEQREDAAGNVDAIAPKAGDPMGGLGILAGSSDPTLSQAGMSSMIAQMLPKKPMQIDTGGAIEYRDPSNPSQLLYSVPKSATPDAALRESGAQARHATPSGSALLGAQTTRDTSLLNPAIVGAREQIARSGRTDVNVGGPTVVLPKEDQEYVKQRRGQQAASFAALEKSAESASKRIDALDRFLAASEKGAAGGVQPLITGIENLLSSFGYSSESLKSVRQMEQVIGDILGTKMAELGARGLTDKDMQILREALPRVAIDRESRKAVVEVLKKADMATLAEYANARSEEARLYPDFAKRTPEQAWFRSYKQRVGDDKPSSGLPAGWSIKPLP